MSSLCMGFFNKLKSMFLVKTVLYSLSHRKISMVRKYSCPIGRIFIRLRLNMVRCVCQSEKAIQKTISNVSGTFFNYVCLVFRNLLPQRQRTIRKLTRSHLSPLHESKRVRKFISARNSFRNVVKTKERDKACRPRRHKLLVRCARARLSLAWASLFATSRRLPNDTLSSADFQ